MQLVCCSAPLRYYSDNPVNGALNYKTLDRMSLRDGQLEDNVRQTQMLLGQQQGHSTHSSNLGGAGPQHTAHHVPGTRARRGSSLVVRVMVPSGANLGGRSNLSIPCGTMLSLIGMSKQSQMHTLFYYL